MCKHYKKDITDTYCSNEIVLELVIILIQVVFLNYNLIIYLLGTVFYAPVS